MAVGLILKIAMLDFNQRDLIVRHWGSHTSGMKTQVFYDVTPCKLLNITDVSM
jgi:hypothetical protein